MLIGKINPIYSMEYSMPYANPQYPMMYDPMFYNNGFQPNFAPFDNFLSPSNFPPSNNFAPPGNPLPLNNFPPSNNFAPSGNFFPQNNFPPSSNFAPSENFLPPNNFPPSNNFAPPGNPIPPSNQPFDPQQQFQNKTFSDFSQPAQLPTPGNPILNANLAPVTPQLTPPPENDVVIATKIIQTLLPYLQNQDDLSALLNALNNYLLQLMQQAPQNVNDINQIQNTLNIIQDIRQKLPDNMKNSLSTVMQFLDTSANPKPSENLNNISESQFANQITSSACTCPQHGKKTTDSAPSESLLSKEIRVCQKHAFMLPGNKEYYLLEKTNTPNGSHYSQQQIYLLPKGSYMIVRLPSSEEFANQQLAANSMLYQSPASMDPVQLPVAIPTN